MVQNIPAIGVTSLETLAYTVTNANIICSLIDAKNEQVYCGIFDDQYNLLEDYTADHIDNIIPHLLKYNNVCFVGNGAILHQPKLEKTLSNISFAKDLNQSAFSLAKCAYRKYCNNDISNADTLLPLYLRKSQAERMKGLQK